MTINLSTLPILSTITQWFVSPSEDIADYVDGDIDSDIIMQGDAVLVRLHNPRQ
jgi:hypothetical protein